MKRMLAAVSFAILAVPAFAAGRAPFEQAQLDRGFLAEIANGASAHGSGSSSAGGSRTPYEQLGIDRGVPPYTLPHEHAGRNPERAKDFNFVAPPQESRGWHHRAGRLATIRPVPLFV